ncbi:hypothetical protein ABLE68_13190 [Nocardioides sp. CN2-186]|uniref:hypothetical protein n=1 Tax=Nocardioides tweenelious TaxID=3156607 RepID=UPI0032B5963E
MKYVAALGLLVVGAGTAIASVALHELVWGFVLMAATTAVTVRALRPGLLRLAFVVGWVATVGWLTVPRPEGDYLISQDWQGYALLALGLVILVVGVATIPRPTPASP